MKHCTLDYFQPTAHQPTPPPPIMSQDLCSSCSNLVIDFEGSFFNEQCGHNTRDALAHHLSLAELENCATQGKCSVCRLLWASFEMKKPRVTNSVHRYLRNVRILGTENIQTRLYLVLNTNPELEPKRIGDMGPLGYSTRHKRPCQIMLKMMASNLDVDLELLKEIRWADLILTHQQSIQVARELGYEYIRIDALCILQDDDDDWAKQSPLVPEIYGNADVSIVAGRSDDSRKGFLNSAYIPRVPPCQAISTSQWGRQFNFDQLLSWAPAKSSHWPHRRQGMVLSRSDDVEAHDHPWKRTANVPLSTGRCFRGRLLEPY